MVVDNPRSLPQRGLFNGKQRERRKRMNEIYNLIRAALFVLLALLYIFFCLTADHKEYPPYTDPTTTIPAAKSEAL